MVSQGLWCGVFALAVSGGRGRLWVSGTWLPPFLVINHSKETVFTVRQELCLLFYLQEGQDRLGALS